MSNISSVVFDQSKRQYIIMNSMFENVIAARVFPLNKSKSKFVTVGLVRNDGILNPKVIFSGQFWTGLEISEDEWHTIISNLRRVRAYFKGESAEEQITISNNLHIFLTEFYDKKSITIRRCK